MNSESEKTFVKFEKIDKSYDGEVLVVKDLNLDIPQGEFLTLLGPSGSGKSTILNCIAGLLDLNEGQIWIEFGKFGENEVSNRYRVAELTCDWDGQQTTINTSKYHFKLKDQLSLK